MERFNRPTGSLKGIWDRVSCWDSLYLFIWEPGIELGTYYPWLSKSYLVDAGGSVVSAAGAFGAAVAVGAFFLWVL